MDVPSTFKSEVFRPLATTFIPGATAIAPYALLVLHYNPALTSFADRFPTLYATILVLAAIAAGMLLEDAGGIIEVSVWDGLIEQETGCHWAEWTAFLRMAPKRDEESVGHRYLRTLTLRLKFELSFGLALMLLWFGLLWLDAVRALWTEDSVLLLSLILLGTTAYSLWESYKTAWVLSQVRHVLVNKDEPKLQERPEETWKYRHLFNWFLLFAAILFGVTGIVIGALHLWPESPLEHRGGLVSAGMLILYAVAMLLGWRWLCRAEARGRRRGMALRLSLACALLSWFAVLRTIYDDRPASYVVTWLSLAVAVAFFVFARKFWAGVSRQSTAATLTGADVGLPPYAA